MQVISVCSGEDRGCQIIYTQQHVNDAMWALLTRLSPVERPRTTDIRAVINAISICCDRPVRGFFFRGSSNPRGTGYHYLHVEKLRVWTLPQRELYEQTCRRADRSASPSVVIIDGLSVKTTESGGVRGFDAHKRVQRCKHPVPFQTPSKFSRNKALKAGKASPLLSATLPLVWSERKRSVQTLLIRGEIPAEIPSSLVNDLFAAPLYGRLVILNEAADNAYLEHRADHLAASWVWQPKAPPRLNVRFLTFGVVTPGLHP